MDGTRRRFIALVAASALAPVAGASATGGTGTPGSTVSNGPARADISDIATNSPIDAPARFASGVRVGEDRHALAVVDADGRVLRLDDLPGRAHGAASHRGSGLSAVFARRPGEWFALFDDRTDVAPRRVPMPGSRRLVGHGAFTSDGAWLHTAENDFDAVRGVLGVHDVRDPLRPRRVAELPTHGIGPHDMLHVPGTDLLLVANGGIATHPDTGRDKLNLADMRPSLALLRVSPGARPERLAEWTLPDAWHRVSLRHLALSADGRVWVGGQDEREAAEQSVARAPLVATAELAHGLRGGRVGVGDTGRHARLALDPVTLPDAAHDALAGYVSSIDATPDAVVVTSSHGGTALLLDARTRTLRAAIPMGDCSGVAATDDVELPWRLTNGRGDFAACDELGLEPRTVHAFAWDNHLTRIA